MKASWGRVGPWTGLPAWFVSQPGDFVPDPETVLDRLLVRIQPVVMSRYGHLIDSKAGELHCLVSLHQEYLENFCTKTKTKKKQVLLVFFCKYIFSLLLSCMQPDMGTSLNVWWSFLNKLFPTVVRDYINIINTTLDFNFDLYKAFNSIDKQKHRNKERLSNIKSFSLITCKLVIRSLLTIKTRIKKSSSLYWYNRLPS